MEIQFAYPRPRYEKLFSALFLTAILCNAFAALDWLHLLPAALIGAGLPLIPRAKHRKAQCVLWSILAAWLLFRFPAILDGGKLLANRMFALSEQTQSYEYDYFGTSGDNPLEAVLWLSILAGILCALWGNKFNAVLCGVWILAMAYFGVTPGTVWLVFLAVTGFLAALPGQHRWFYGLMTGVLLVCIALAATQIAPAPSKAVSALDDRLRDVLSVQSVVYEQTPVPTEVPEPEIVPQPDTRQEQPDHGVQKNIINILFMLLAALTLALLFIPAVIKDRAAKRREQARVGLDDSDHSAAIRAMYLYAQRWNRLSDSTQKIPPQVNAIWQEAAYSDHTMCDTQREVVHTYMRDSAEKVWKEADWKTRLNIRYRICL